MRNGLFAKLALVNIKKNHQTYVPYILASLFDVAMLYMMLFINNNAGMKRIRHSGDVLMITSMGVGIIIIFSFIFLLYSNSFLMKRRQKELGLYNILGLEKRHISIVMSNRDYFFDQFSRRNSCRNSGKQACPFAASEADSAAGCVWI